MGKKVFVTGAAGFIGSHVTQQLLARGDDVVGVDNLNDYYEPARKRANLAQLYACVADTQQFTCVEGDVRDRQLLARLFDSCRFDAVVHLAAMAGVRASVADPHLYYDVNLVGTLNLLDAARDHNTQNFVFATTSSVYGDNQRIPFVETDACDRPLAPYPASKRSAEMLGYTYHYLHGLNFTALRFFTVYGPRNRPDMMAYKLLDNMFFGRNVALYNNGQLHRDWTYIDDIVGGILAAVDRPLGYEIINLGRGEPVLLADFVRCVEELVGRRAQLVPAPRPDADVVYTYADISKAQRLLGYAPKVSVHEGVAWFWHWYQKAVLEKA